MLKILLKINLRRELPKEFGCSRGNKKNRRGQKCYTFSISFSMVPGTKRISYLEENAAAVNITLTPEDLERIEAVSPKNLVHGERMQSEQMKQTTL
ncbi:hypothetical protein [Peribacillus muralis]|uniref:hypothetical protein n=1 Tax=Peribacillus muralis TaxID=264697 RepID=UPI003D02B47F